MSLEAKRYMLLGWPWVDNSKRPSTHSSVGVLSWAPEEPSSDLNDAPIYDFSFTNPAEIGGDRMP